MKTQTDKGASADSLGDRMKQYEAAYEQKLMPQVPAIIRLDGKNFHTVTHSMDRPFDVELTRLMQSITLQLVNYTNAVVGYQQSDEITLVLYYESYLSELIFAGKCNKINSVLASMAGQSYEEDRAILCEKYAKFDYTAAFDCRCFSVPTKWEAINCLRWREQDATRNSIQMAARSVYSHKECEKKNCQELQDMLHEKGINWNDYPDSFKRGSYWTRKGNLRIPPINKIQNPVEVIFEQAEVSYNI